LTGSDDVVSSGARRRKTSIAAETMKNAALAKKMFFLFMDNLYWYNVSLSGSERYSQRERDLIVPSAFTHVCDGRYQFFMYLSAFVLFVGTMRCRGMYAALIAADRYDDSTPNHSTWEKRSASREEDDCRRCLKHSEKQQDFQEIPLGQPLFGCLVLKPIEPIKC